MAAETSALQDVLTALANATTAPLPDEDTKAVPQDEGAPSDAAAEGEPPGEEKLTREERMAMAEAMRKNCISLTELLQTLVRQEQELKEVCGEFIIRDVEEENQRIALTRRCLAEQQETMRSAAYVRWAQENGKGDLAHGGAPRQVHPGVGTASGSGVAADYSFHHSDVDFDFMQLESLGATVPQRIYGCTPALVQVLMGWRERSGNAGADEELAEIEAARRVMSPAVIAVNGHVLRDAMPATSENVTAFAAEVERRGGDTSDAGQIYAAWRSWVLAQSATRGETEELLHGAVKRHALTDLLRDDGTDTVALLPLSACDSGLDFSAVCHGAKVVAAETPLPNVSTASAAGVTLQQGCEALGALLGRDVDSNQKGKASSSPLLRVYRCTAQRSPSNDSIRLTILCGERVTPASRFDRFSWPDLCGIARVAADNAGSTATVLRETTTRVAELEPHDSLSSEWFPHLNARYVAKPSTAAPPPASAPHHPRDGTAMSQVALVAIASGICIAGITVGWALGNRGR